MAIRKSITNEDGVTTNYHRIFYVQNMPNSHVSIAVLSLVSEEIRDEQKAGEIEHPYTHSVTYETEKVSEMTTAEAYNYLKTLPAFEGAEDC